MTLFIIAGKMTCLLYHRDRISASAASVGLRESRTCFSQIDNAVSDRQGEGNLLKPYSIGWCTDFCIILNQAGDRVDKQQDVGTFSLCD